MSQALAPRSAPLYELTAEYLEVLNLLDDQDADPAALEAELDAIAGAITGKAESIAAIVTECGARAGMLRSEADRLRDRAEAEERKATRLKEYLFKNMQLTGAEKIATTRFTISVRTNPPAVQVLEPMMVPTEYIRTVTTTSCDKRAVLDHFKATGEIPAGIEIARGVRLEIK
jgi:hypothetical protein